MNLSDLQDAVISLNEAAPLEAVLLEVAQLENWNKTKNTIHITNAHSMVTDGRKRECQGNSWFRFQDACSAPAARGLNFYNFTLDEVIDYMIQIHPIELTCEYS